MYSLGSLLVLSSKPSIFIGSIHHPLHFIKLSIAPSCQLKVSSSQASLPAMGSQQLVEQEHVPDALAGDSKEPDHADSIAQYVVIRKDIVDSLKWPLGSVITQACHAAVAAVWLHREHSDTHRYCGDLDSMTTVTLEVKGESQLVNLAQKLQAGGIAHKLWIEQPENFPTCLATKPYPKSEVAHYFKKLKLCK